MLKWPAKTTELFVVLLAICAALALNIRPASVSALGLGSRFDQLSSSDISVAATHLFGFNYANNISPVGSVAFEFCSNDPLVGTACTAPAGFDISAAALAAQSGFTGFIIDSVDTTANRMVISRAIAAAPSAGASTYRFDNVINPSAAGSYYVRLSTYSSLNGTGAPIEYAGLVFAILASFNVTTEVPPYLIFCTAITISGFDCSSATTYSIDFGEFNPTAASSGSSQFVVATNAGLGYNVTVNGTTLTSGSNTIPAQVIPTSSNPGTSQFGINLRANTIPPVGADPAGSGSGIVSTGYDTPNQYKYVSGDVIASASTTSDNSKFTVSYVANISASQPAGYYATTISYICLANF